MSTIEASQLPEVLSAAVETSKPDSEVKEIFNQMRPILIDRLGLEAEDEVLPTSRLTEDLGADKIDGLDLGFQLRKAGLDIAMPTGEAVLGLKTVGGLIQRAIEVKNSSR